MADQPPAIRGGWNREAPNTAKSSEAGPQTKPRVQWSGFRVQDLRVYVELQVLNPEPRTLNPTNLTHLQQLSETKYPRAAALPAAMANTALETERLWRVFSISGGCVTESRTVI